MINKNWRHTWIKALCTKILTFDWLKAPQFGLYYPSIHLIYCTPFDFRTIYLKSLIKSIWKLLYFWLLPFVPHKNRTLWLWKNLFIFDFNHFACTLWSLGHCKLHNTWCTLWLVENRHLTDESSVIGRKSPPYWQELCDWLKIAT